MTDKIDQLTQELQDILVRQPTLHTFTSRNHDKEVQTAIEWNNVYNVWLSEYEEKINQLEVELTARDNRQEI